MVENYANEEGGVNVTYDSILTNRYHYTAEYVNDIDS